ncbi:glycoside hydrolase family 3 C-terminal domain-containing protein [Dysgonomonas sp. GY75]|uniref:glycoside hydrolase family 3 N-terminal domain-containing protein n=1 Tax=Dysgonomonas sp. GY75 TaxID=2780419 RepID=UPI00188462C2|nr:glycoside hydrolase family 3 C-terminal domain-containing protein [Dysgonomonas sp. GY75]
MESRRITALMSFFYLIILCGCTKRTDTVDAKMDKFINDLLSRMTLEEKIGQTVLYTSGYDVITGPTVDPNYKEYLKKGMVGGIFNAVGADYTRSLQKIAVEDTHLGIPLIFGYDVIHGQRTIFPIPLAESCSWDLEAMERSAKIAASEATAEGINWIYAPMVDISRDPRWGRVAEGAGEDVYLGSLIAAARVKGFQGNSMSDYNTVVACVKHYAAYGATMAGRDYNTVDMSLNELWNTFLPPFKAALDAGCGTIMTSFNDLNGIPATGNKYLLKDILRDKWNFNGFVVTDYTSINEIIPHGYAGDEKHSAEIAMNAGVDMDMQGGAYMNHLKTLVEEGKVYEKEVTEAARAILRIKYKLGLFEDPYRYCDAGREKTDILTAGNKEAARDMARKSMVLLKNDNQTLPLKGDKSIALIGPLAKDQYEILGCWSAMGDRDTVPVSVYEGLTVAVGEKHISYARGCDIQSDDTKGFNEAVRIASKADVVVMVMGEFHNMSGENNSRTNLSLPGVQTDLLKAIKKTGKPMVLVLMNGRPLTINWEKENVDAILEAWFPGTMGGAAIADVLTGKYNPAGKLTMTFPQHVGQIPLFYNHKNTGRPFDPDDPQFAYGSKYWDVSNDPLYPFGHGLSYTTFSYSGITLSSKEMTEDNPIKVSVKLTNTGKYDGEEVVQLYTRDLVGSVTRPVKELKGFRKVFLKAGESQSIEFMLTADDLRFYNTNLEYICEPGDFHLFVGGSSETKIKTGFVLK